MTFAEAAVTLLARGDSAGAAHEARLALQRGPEDAIFQALAGTVLLQTGDAHGALTAFTNATACAPQDGLALYGRGLAQLACGDRSAALASFQRSEQHGGDRNYLLLARRYTQWLGGGQIASGGGSLPGSFQAALYALQGMTALRQGDPQRALNELKAAQNALPGSPVLQPAGVLMTFEAARPLNTSAPRLASAGGLDAPLPKEPALKGEVVLTPQDLPSGVAYVGYDIDGQAFNLVNVQPYVFQWNTLDVPDGWHTVIIQAYDPSGKEIGRSERRVRTLNRRSGETGEASLAERRSRLRSALWQALALHPDRAACAYALGTTYRALGARPAARLWLERAAALRPDYRDVRQQLAACGGLPAGGEAIWGGLTTEKVVALTFDDGPKPGATEPLLTILQQEHVPATFFVIGRHVLEYPEVTRQIAAAGMEIANHSFTHRNLARLSTEDDVRELLQTQAAVQAVTGRTPRFVRPPGGDWNTALEGIAKEWGLTPCFWTVDAFSAEVVGAQQVAETVLKQVQPGSIILMHNGKMTTIQALPAIIRGLRARGYTFVTIDTLDRRLNAASAATRNAARLAAIANAHRPE